MYEEIVSLAIIMDFILNLLYVDHPNNTSITVLFVVSLAVIAPPALGLRYWLSQRRLNGTRNTNEDTGAEPMEGWTEVTESYHGMDCSADLETGYPQTVEMQ